MAYTKNIPLTLTFDDAEQRSRTREMLRDCGLPTSQMTHATENGKYLLRLYPLTVRPNA